MSRTSKPKIFMFHSEDSAVGYYRVWSPAKWLNKMGLAEVRTLPHPAIKFPIAKKNRNPELELGSMEEVGEWADLIVFQRLNTYLQYSTMEAIRATYKKPIVFELDDNLVGVHRKHTQYEIFKEKDPRDVFDIFRMTKAALARFPAKDKVVQIRYNEGDPDDVTVVVEKNFDVRWLTLRSASRVDAMTVTTDFLKELYSPYCKDVYVAPNCLDFEVWDKVRPVRPKKNHLVIGWGGGGQHKFDLNVIVPAIEKVLKRYPYVSFHFCGATNDRLDWIRRKYFRQRIRALKKCYIDNFPGRMSQWNWDIGIIPVQDNDFNKGKSNIKWMEYSALGIPAVASNVLPYQNIINGKTGMLVNNSTDAWVEAISKLVEDPILRKDIGEMAHKDVRTFWNMERGVHLYAKAYKEVIDKFDPSKVDTSATDLAGKLAQQQGSDISQRIGKKELPQSPKAEEPVGAASVPYDESIGVRMA